MRRNSEPNFYQYRTEGQDEPKKTTPEVKTEASFHLDQRTTEHQSWCHGDKSLMPLIYSNHQRELTKPLITFHSFRIGISAIVADAAGRHRTDEELHEEKLVFWAAYEMRSSHTRRLPIAEARSGIVNPQGPERYCKLGHGPFKPHRWRYGVKRKKVFLVGRQSTCQEVRGDITIIPSVHDPTFANCGWHTLYSRCLWLF
jgi:hypothetical protein